MEHLLPLHAVQDPVKQSHIACSVLFLSTSLIAQGSMTTPPGGLTGESHTYEYVMGIWSEMRLQLIDDMHTDSKARAITEVAFRLDYRIHDSTTAMGRTWTNIAMDASELAKPISGNFASNLGASSTRVFDSKWSWPTQIGFPPLRPDAWGGAQGRLRFPFMKPWVYSAKKPIVTEYTFRGGTLANNGEWGRWAPVGFFLDGEYFNGGQARASVQQVPPTPPPCHDSGLWWFPSGSFTYGTATAYGRNNSATLGGKLVFSHYSDNTAASAPVIHALGAGGIPNGLNVGSGCNKLYVDLSKPHVLLSTITDPTGRSDLMNWSTTWQSEFSSLGIWLQAAWPDSKTSALKLTAATLLSLPRVLPPDNPLRYWNVYSVDLGAKWGTGPSNAGALFVRYKLQ